jgi:hypothetical protein
VNRIDLTPTNYGEQRHVGVNLRLGPSHNCQTAPPADV